MQAYPPQYTEHNLPLIVLSGLGEQEGGANTGTSIPSPESGTKISCSSPECDGELARSLLQQFLRLDGRDAAWHSQALSGPSGALKYYMKAIGRVGTARARSSLQEPQADHTGLHAPATQGRTIGTVGFS